jgi:hypothetical protein
MSRIIRQAGSIQRAPVVGQAQSIRIAGWPAPAVGRSTRIPLVGRSV